MNVVAEKILCKHACLELIPGLICFLLKGFVRVGTNDKPLVRTENSSSVNVWSERLRIMFLLYWKVYVLMDLVVNLWNEDLHWFCGKKTFIDGGVYVRFSGGVGSRVIFSVFM